MAPSGNETIKAFFPNHTKESAKVNINETNTFKVDNKSTSVTSNIVDLNVVNMLPIYS